MQRHACTDTSAAEIKDDSADRRRSNGERSQSLYFVVELCSWHFLVPPHYGGFRSPADARSKPKYHELELALAAEIAVKTVCDATSLPKASAKTSQAALQAARIYK